ncbi:MAG: exopolysaccharide biosynthesis polyprenyl glycosylphosphotransferase [Kiritimatiellales bacterium]
MSTYTEGITIDSDLRDANSFFRRRVMDSFALSLVDTVMLLCAVLLGEAVLFWKHGISVDPISVLFLIPAWWAGVWISRLVPGWGLGVVEELRRIELLLVALFGFALAILFIQKELSISRISFLTAYLTAAILLPLGRVVVKNVLTALNLWGAPAVIYGDRGTAGVIAEALRRDSALGFVPRAVFSNEYRQGEIVCGLPVMGSLRNTTRRVSVAIVVLPDLPRPQLISLLEGPLQQYNTVLLIPDLQDAPSLWVRPCDIQGILGLEIRRNLLDPMALFPKAFIERALVILTLPIWGPVCLLLMLLVWLQDFHSPIYAQERIGRGNVPFRTYKLRTMVPDAETVLLQKLASHPELKAEWEKHYKLKKDPRITFIGRFLRKTSLDELPQLWCVLIGTMGLVGPRPLPKYHHDELNPRTQRLRVKVRPGITGLWQVSGRSDSGTAGMDKWDTYYVTNWSIWLDIVIVAKTVRTVLCGSGAY